MLVACKRFVVMYPNASLSVLGICIAFVPMVELLAVVFWAEQVGSGSVSSPIAGAVKLWYAVAGTQLHDYVMAAVSIVGFLIFTVGWWRLKFWWE